MKPTLRFSICDVAKHAARYEINDRERRLEDAKDSVLSRGYMTKPELQLLAEWKATRSAGHIKKNSEAYIEDVTGFALAAQDERSRIQSLTILDGVAWPTASCILHLFHPDPYPILDFRALWSLSLAVPKQYKFDFWMPYVDVSRNLARQAKTDMRSLDRALWQYSKVNG